MCTMIVLMEHVAGSGCPPCARVTDLRRRSWKQSPLKPRLAHRAPERTSKVFAGLPGLRIGEGRGAADAAGKRLERSSEPCGEQHQPRRLRGRCEGLDERLAREKTQGLTIFASSSLGCPQWLSGHVRSAVRCSHT